MRNTLSFICLSSCFLPSAWKNLGRKTCSYLRYKQRCFMTAFSRHPPFHTVVNPFPSVHTEGKGLTTVRKGFKCPPLQMRTSSELALGQTSTTTSTQPSQHYIVLNSTFTPVVTPAQHSPLLPQLHPVVSHHYTHNIISNDHSPLHLQLRPQLHPIILITLMPTVTSSHYLPLHLLLHPIIIHPCDHSNI